MEAVEQAVTNAVQKIIHYTFIITQYIPFSDRIYKYCSEEPYRVLIELVLVIFTLRYLFAKKYKLNNSDIKLTAQEIEELVQEWTPEPLVPETTQDPEKDLPVIYSASEIVVKTLRGNLVNFASFNFLGLANNAQIKEKTVEALKTYGVGTCGPRGFYGTLDVHLSLEDKIAAFLGVDAAITYAQGFSALSSVIPAFSKRGDLLVVDEQVNFALHVGSVISRSHVRYYKHNDMNDLERVLLDVQMSDLKKGRKELYRRFIVSEGVFVNTGTIVNLPKVLELAEKYKYRTIIDESVSMGTLGSRGAGVTDYYGIEARRVDMIVSTMSNAWASAGGFCAGSMHVVDHQRLSGAAYCFSASLPAMLAVGAHEAINVIEKEPEMVTRLHENVRYFHQLVKEYLMGKFEIEGDGDSPVVHLRVNGEEDRIKRIVDECAENGYLVTVAKYSEQERIKRRKSIRIAISGGHSFEQIKGFVECLSKIEPSKIELPKIEIAKIE